MSPAVATKMMEYDMKTARVLCHLVATDPEVQAAVRKSLEKSVTNVPLENVIRDAQCASSCIGMVLKNNHMLETLGDIAYSIHDAFEHMKLNFKPAK